MYENRKLYVEEEKEWKNTENFGSINFRESTAFNKRNFCVFANFCKMGKTFNFTHLRNL